MQTQGKKEIVEAVVIAGLSALVGACINFGVEKVKAREAKRTGDKERILALEKELSDLKASKQEGNS